VSELPSALIRHQPETCAAETLVCALTWTGSVTLGWVGGDSADEQEQLAGLEAAVKAAQVELEAVMNPPAPEPTGGKKGAPPAEAEAPDADRVAECEAALAEKQMMLKETVERLDVRAIRVNLRAHV
jgi:hypothetical protein